MASPDSYIATVIQWPGTYAPDNWAFCEGQMLSVAEYQPLFSIISNRFGGDGINNFALPDMRGRIPIGAGRSIWNTIYNLGQSGGAETIQLNSAHLPSHNHNAAFTKTTTSTLQAFLSIPVNTTNSTDGGNSPENKYFGNSDTTKPYYSSATTGSTMASVNIDFTGNVNGKITLTNTGESAPFSIVQPYIALHHIICIKGTYPPRD